MCNYGDLNTLDNQLVMLIGFIGYIAIYFYCKKENDILTEKGNKLGRALSIFSLISIILFEYLISQKVPIWIFKPIEKPAISWLLSFENNYQSSIFFFLDAGLSGTSDSFS